MRSVSGGESLVQFLQCGVLLSAETLQRVVLVDHRKDQIILTGRYGCNLRRNVIHDLIRPPRSNSRLQEVVTTRPEHRQVACVWCVGNELRSSRYLYGCAAGGYGSKRECAIRQCCGEGHDAFNPENGTPRRS